MGREEAPRKRDQVTRAAKGAKAAARAAARRATVSTREALKRFRSPRELREVLGGLLTRVDSDESVGPRLRATGLRLRFEFPDAGLVLNVAASDQPDHHLRWAFTDAVDWEPALNLRMDSEVANAYLQGKESLPVAIARGRVRFSGGSRVALIYLANAGLLVDPYQKLVREQYPHLVMD